MCFLNHVSPFSSMRLKIIRWPVCEAVDAQPLACEILCCARWVVQEALFVPATQRHTRSAGILVARGWSLDQHDRLERGRWDGASCGSAAVGMLESSRKVALGGGQHRDGDR